MKRDCAESPDSGQGAEGWRFDAVKRTYDNDALVAFVDLLATRRLYESTLPAEGQATKMLKELIRKSDIIFCEFFDTQEIQENFDVSIFGDSIVISPRKRIPDIVERLVELLLEYQADLILKYASPSRAILLRDSFFSFKVTGASKLSILGSPHTSVSLCGGKSLISAHKCIQGLPIGVYVARDVEGDLATEQRTRIIPVKQSAEYKDLSFVKMKRDIRKYLPSKTSRLLEERPGVSAENIIGSIKAAFAEDAPKEFEAIPGSRCPRDVLRSSLQDRDAFDKKWTPWILAHLGKLSEIIRERKQNDTI